MAVEVAEYFVEARVRAIAVDFTVDKAAARPAAAGRGLSHPPDRPAEHDSADRESHEPERIGRQGVRALRPAHQDLSGGRRRCTGRGQDSLMKVRRAEPGSRSLIGRTFRSRPGRVGGRVPMDGDAFPRLSPCRSSRDSFRGMLESPVTSMRDGVTRSSGATGPDKTGAE